MEHTVVDNFKNVFFAILIFVPAIVIFSPYWLYVDYQNKDKYLNRFKDGWERWIMFLIG